MLCIQNSDETNIFQCYKNVIVRSIMYCGFDTSSIKQRFCKGKCLKIPNKFCPEWLLNNNELSYRLTY